MAATRRDSDAQRRTATPVVRFAPRPLPVPAGCRLLLCCNRYPTRRADAATAHQNHRIDRKMRVTTWSSRRPRPSSPCWTLAAVLAMGCLLGRCGAVDVSFGSCPTKQVVQDFNVARYMGQWYEIERFWQIFELGGKCSKALYTLDSASGKVTVKNSMIDTRTKQEKSIEGSAELANAGASPSEAKLIVTFNIPVVGSRKAPYWVLDTDYDNYALVYSCSTYIGFVKVESAWILSRTATISADVQQQIESAITKAGLNRKSFQKTLQDCE